jgi:hypothetical protein
MEDSKMEFIGEVKNKITSLVFLRKMMKDVLNKKMPPFV